MLLYYPIFMDSGGKLFTVHSDMHRRRMVRGPIKVVVAILTRMSEDEDLFFSLFLLLSKILLPDLSMLGFNE